ncbi:hypothetical protein L596_010183 [Steinernema carpocapsae]|uniref:Uncharacterized protein n=1 Tax=Steinernema carpocapsae TaxID=34508 RepID=A0A4U5PHV4_STECR|nr:hypothetical protein L596_010183 [Steinernema carpocapsae]
MVLTLLNCLFLLAMDFMPHQFIDDILHQLSRESFSKTKVESDAFTEVREEHLERRVWVDVSVQNGKCNANVKL